MEKIIASTYSSPKISFDLANNSRLVLIGCKTLCD